MKLSTLLLITPMASAWSLSRFDPFSTPTMSLIRRTVFFPSAGQLLRDQRDWLNHASREITQTSPRYELTDNDQEFKVAIDVPGMTSKDISISLEDGFLSIKGTRESSSENYRFTSKFSQCFSIDPTVEIDKFAANLENGVLVISAPKDAKKIEERVRTIPILEAAAPKSQDEAKIEVNKGVDPVTVEAKEHKEEEVMDLDEVKG
jgi:HSP20 family protein